MRAWATVAASAVVALACLAAASAAVSVPSPAASSTGAGPLAAAASCAPPCGYVAPLIDLVFEGKKSCGGAEVDLEKCYALPELGQTLKVDGVLRYYWKESEDLTYPADPATPVTITFAKAANAPTWLTFSVEPATFTIDQVAFLDPANTKTDSSTSPPTVYYWFERPIAVTFKHEADPTGDAVKAIANKDGVQELYVKAKSTGSGQYIKESFGGETFRFDASRYLTDAASTSAGAAGTKSSPMGGLLAPVIGLAVALLTVRRARAA